MTTTIMNLVREDTIRRKVLPLSSTELLLNLGLPAHARVLVNGVTVDSLTIQWLEEPDLVVPADPLAVASGVQRHDALHERTICTCEIAQCAGRKVNGQGPFASHVRWHEGQGDEIPESMYELAGIAPKDRARRRRRA